MFELLDDYLRVCASHEERVMIANALAAFDKVEYEDYELGYTEILQTEEQHDAGETMLLIVNLTQQMLHQILNTYAVFMDHETTTIMLTNIVVGIADLANYEDRHAVQAAVHLDASPEEIFCELLTLTTRYAVEDIRVHLESVSQCLVTRYKEEELHLEMEDEETSLYRVARLHSFRMFDAFLTEGAPARVRDMIRSGVDVGMPFKTYADTIGTDFEQMEPDIIAEEMFGIAIISNDGYQRPQETIKEHLEDYIANADTAIAVMAKVGQILIGFKP